MRTIPVSTDVFAEIWKRHKPGDTTEDQILRRVLKLPSANDEVVPLESGNGHSGYEDPRFGVRVPENFEIFRIYKGREYRARATGGKWLLVSDKKLYPSLHKLSWAVVSNHENSWYNWKYRSSDGEELFIHNLRDAAKVSTRV